MGRNRRDQREPSGGVAGRPGKSRPSLTVYGSNDRTAKPNAPSPRLHARPTNPLDGRRPPRIRSRSPRPGSSQTNPRTAWVVYAVCPGKIGPHVGFASTGGDTFPRDGIGLSSASCPAVVSPDKDGSSPARTSSSRRSARISSSFHGFILPQYRSMSDKFRRHKPLNTLPPQTGQGDKTCCPASVYHSLNGIGA